MASTAQILQLPGHYPRVKEERTEGSGKKKDKNLQELIIQNSYLVLYT